ncbi:MFS transporter [Streptomyces sp. BYX5S]
MLTVLRHRAYRRLFGAQVVALVGTGLATVALGLLAYDVAGAEAGAVLGTALAIKMTAYVLVAPVVGAFTERLPRRALMVGSDLLRAAVALALPFVTQVWQVYVLVFALQSASALFTPTFQALIPDVLPDERDYTRALSLARLAYDLESLFSPALAAALLSVVSYHHLFTGTVVGFLASAGLVASTALPERPAAPARVGGVFAKATAGMRLFLAVPSLRGLLALNLAVAAASAMVTVNSVVYVRDFLGLAAGAVPVALGAYGAGSMVVALVVPRVVERVGERAVMVRGALSLGGVFAGLGLITAVGSGSWRVPALLVVWVAFGGACSMVLTPVGRVVRWGVPAGMRGAAFAAQFSLSHACWLVAYPLAGWLGVWGGLGAAVGGLGMVAVGAGGAGARLWPGGSVRRSVSDATGLRPGPRSSIAGGA